ncbi:MAG: enoyl-CoA hydratase-related protein [Dehalococcoidia bacterium]
MVVEDIRSHLLVEKKDRIAYVTLNRPERLNAVTNAHWDQLSETWLALEEDPEVWVIIVTGAGDKAFCTGQDLKDLAQRGGNEDAGGDLSVERSPGPTPIFDLEMWTPAIAAINGYCVAGGLEIALCCDIRVAAEHAEFGLQEVRWGLIPNGGGVDKLPRAIPICIAMEMLLTGQRIDAQEAHRVGLINRVVPADQVMPTAEAIARRICENGPLAVRAIKENVYRGYNMYLGHARRFEDAFAELLSRTEDAIEGPRAFSEKRKPQFKGR